MLFFEICPNFVAVKKLCIINDISFPPLQYEVCDNVSGECRIIAGRRGFGSFIAYSYQCFLFVFMMENSEEV